MRVFVTGVIYSGTQSIDCVSSFNSTWWSGKSRLSILLAIRQCLDSKNRNIIVRGATSERVTHEIDWESDYPKQSLAAHLHKAVLLSANAYFRFPYAE